MKRRRRPPVTTTAAATLAILAAVAGGTGCQSNAPVGRTYDSRTLAAGGPGELPPAESARLCVNTAQALERQGYAREAIAQYERALHFDSGVPDAPHRLAVLYAAQGDDAHALAAFDAAIKAQPDDPSVAGDLGYFHLAHGNPAEAERWLRRAVGRDPAYARGWVNLGVALADQQRFDESYAAFARALGPAQAKSNVGVLMAQQGRYRDADRTLREALAMDSTIPQSRATLQWVDARLAATSPPPPQPATAPAGP